MELEKRIDSLPGPTTTAEVDESDVMGDDSDTTVGTLAPNPGLPQDGQSTSALKGITYFQLDSFFLEIVTNLFLFCDRLLVSSTVSLSVNRFSILSHLF